MKNLGKNIVTLCVGMLMGATLFGGVGLLQGHSEHQCRLSGRSEGPAHSVRHQWQQLCEAAGRG